MEKIKRLQGLERQEALLNKKIRESCTSSDEQLLYKISFFLSYLFF